MTLGRPLGHKLGTVNPLAPQPFFSLVPMSLYIFSKGEGEEEKGGG